MKELIFCKDVESRVTIGIERKYNWIKLKIIEMIEFDKCDKYDKYDKDDKDDKGCGE